MTAGSVVTDVDPDADHAESEQVSRRQLKAEAKASARAQRDEAKVAAQAEDDELGSAAASERDEAQAAREAVREQARANEQAEREAEHQAQQIAKNEAKEAARVAREQAKRAKVQAKEKARRERKQARKAAGPGRFGRLTGGSGASATPSTPVFSATPIADALAAEFPLPDRPNSDMADREREIQQRREDEARAKAGNSRSARRARAAEAKEAGRRARDEAKVAQAAAKAEERAASHRAKAEEAEQAAGQVAFEDEEATARTDELGRTESEPTESEPTEPDATEPSDVVVAPAATSRIENAIAEAKERVTAQAEQDEAEAKAREAKGAARRERDAAKAEAAGAKKQARRERAAAKATAKAAEAEVKAKSKPAHDDFVEAPREPKLPLAQRLRQGVGTADEDPDAPASTKGRNALAVLAVVLGSLGFICSVILAIGAFLVALSPHNSSALFDKISSVCDFLVGPLRDVFSFSGVNGDSKDALVAWGLGALGYLIVGLFAQTFLRSHAED